MALLYEEAGAEVGRKYQLARSTSGKWFYRYNENARWSPLSRRFRAPMLAYITSDATGPDEIIQGGKLFHLKRTVQPELPQE